MLNFFFLKLVTCEVKVSVKVKTWILEIPVKKGENFKAVIFTTKKHFFSMHNFMGSSMVLFSSFCMTYVCQKTNLKIFHMDIFKGFGRYESHFRTDWLAICHIYSQYIHDTHIVRFFENFNFKNFKEYFSLKLIFWKFPGKRKITILKFWDSHFVHLIILRLLMFYNLKLLDNWMRCGRLNIDLILRDNRV